MVNPRMSTATTRKMGSSGDANIDLRSDSFTWAWGAITLRSYPGELWHLGVVDSKLTDHKVARHYGPFAVELQKVPERLDQLLRVTVWKRKRQESALYVQDIYSI